MILLIFILASLGGMAIITESFLFVDPKKYFRDYIDDTDEKKIQKFYSCHFLSKLTNGWYRYALDKIHYMTGCQQCSGFWVGFWLGLFLTPISAYYPMNLFVEMITCGFMASCCSVVYSYILNWLETL